MVAACSMVALLGELRDSFGEAKVEDTKDKKANVEVE